MASTRRLVTTLFILLSLCLTAAPMLAERADDADRKSKNGKAEGTIDGVHVVVEYGAPQVRDREIWGDLVPFGEIWRTGADEATTITFDAPVTIQGKALAAGTYSLFTIPNKDSWTVIFNKEAKQWGHYKYDQSKDALRVEVKPKSHSQVEALTFAVKGNKVMLHWDELAVGFTVAKG